MPVGSVEIVTLASGGTATKKRFLSDAQCKQSARRIMGEMVADQEGRRGKLHLFYGPMDEVVGKVEFLYHSEEAKIILAHLEKMQEGKA